MEKELLLAELYPILLPTITLVGAALALYLTFLYLPPRLTIIEIKDKSANHSLESRIIVKNIGKLPALDVVANVLGLEAEIGFMKMSQGNLTGGKAISRLNANESIEIPALPQIQVQAGMPLKYCRYILEIKYSAKVNIFECKHTRSWSIELRNLGDSFVWQHSPNKED